MSAAVPLLYLAHLIGLALGMGSATVKTALLLKCRADPAFVPGFVRVSKVLTPVIVAGLALLILSGVGWWIIAAVQLTTRLVLKLALVVAILVIGPVIDNAVTPKYTRLAPEAGLTASPDFLKVQRQYIGLEVTATALFYVIAAIWVLR